MMRGFWLALPLFLVVALDGALTLLAQPAGWWVAGIGARGANPAGMWFLAYGPKAFALAMAGWAGLVLLFSDALPGILGRTLYAAALMGHAAGALDWASGHAPLLLRRYASRTGGPAFLETWASSPNAGVWLCLLLLAVVPLVTCFCLARAGVLAAAKAPKKSSSDKGDKKKGKDE